MRSSFRVGRVDSYTSNIVHACEEGFGDGSFRFFISTSFVTFMVVKPLRECLKALPSGVRRDYDSAMPERLFELIVDCDSKLIRESADSKRVDAFRAVIWFANAALCRHGIPPRSRTCLGPIPTKPTRLLHHVRKEDAPYIDLQWLGYRKPDIFPRRWRDVRLLIGTAPTKKVDAREDPETILIEPIEPNDPSILIDDAFDAADRLIYRKDSIADKCRRLKLAPADQILHRWLCSRSSIELLKDIEEKEAELRKTMRLQGIKQLTDERIEQRLLIFRAWRLVGGGHRWQETANVYQAMTGRSITRQAVKDMIERMGEKKLIRRRGKRVKTAQPLIFDAQR